VGPGPQLTHPRNAGAFLRRNAEEKETIRMPGPAPKPDGARRRRNPSIAMTKLPAGGREGAPPEWPLIADVVMTARRNLAAAKVEQLEYDAAEAEGAKRGRVERLLDAAMEKLAILDAQLAAQRELEDRLWRDLWATPQAVAWERLGWTRDVAAYVRHKVLGELGHLDEAKEARAWSDRIGLTPMAMLRLRWEVAADELAEKREEKAATPVKAAPRRVRAVDTANAVARS
jgi:hypothetical protein